MYVLPSLQMEFQQDGTKIEHFSGKCNKKETYENNFTFLLQLKIVVYSQYVTQGNVVPCGVTVCEEG